MLFVLFLLQQAALEESQSERDKLENLHIKQIKSRDIEVAMMVDVKCCINIYPPIE